MKLYELAQAYQELLEKLDSEEFDNEAVADTLDAIDEAFEEKAENIVKVIRQLEYEAKVMKAEKERLAKLQKSKENQVNRLREYLKHYMLQVGKNKVKTPFCNINVKDKKPTFEVVNINALGRFAPEHVQWEPKVIDKTALNKKLAEALKKQEPEKLGIKVIQGEKTITIR